jgi:hypothetical protein
MPAYTHSSKTSALPAVAAPSRMPGTTPGTDSFNNSPVSFKTADPPGPIVVRGEGHLQSCFKGEMPEPIPGVTPAFRETT